MGEIIFALFIGLWMIGLGILINVYMKKEYERIKKNDIE